MIVVATERAGGDFCRKQGWGWGQKKLMGMWMLWTWGERFVDIWGRLSGSYGDRELQSMQFSRQVSFSMEAERGCCHLEGGKTAVGKMEGITQIWKQKCTKSFLRLKLFLMFCGHSFKSLEGWKETCLVGAFLYIIHAISYLRKVQQENSAVW